jgi:hypothetical protein
VGLFGDAKLKLRMSKRVGAFVRARKQGMSAEEARAYSDNLYLPTEEDIAYEERVRQRDR